MEGGVCGCVTEGGMQRSDGDQAARRHADRAHNDCSCTHLA